MTLWSRLRSWKKAILRRSRIESDMDAELRSHIEAYVEDLIRNGSPREEAVRRAHIEFGGIERIKEECRDSCGIHLIESILRDLRFGLRMLRKSPGFTGVAVLILALGIGANTAIFSLIDAVMLHSLPVRDPSQLVVFEWATRKPVINAEYSTFSDCGKTGAGDSSGCSFPLPLLKDFQSQTNAFSGVFACAGPAKLDLNGNGPASIVAGEIVSGDYFSTLGVNAFIGRTLGPRDDSLSAPPAAVLSYAYWQSAFAGNRSVIGRTIVLNNIAFTVVGVASPNFTTLSPGKAQDLWLTISMVPRLQIDWGRRIEGYTNWWLLVMARLKSGVSLERAQTAASLAFRNEILYGPKPLPKAADDPEILLTLAQDALIGKRGQLSSILYLLASAVGIILLIACATVAGLLLSRASTRQKEMAVRLTLGASRSVLLRQLVTESMLLSVLGGVFGIVFAYWGVHAITALVTRGSSQRFPYVLAPDWRVLAFTLAICILTGVVFGLAPALRSTRVDLTPALKENAFTLLASPTDDPRFRVGNALVIVQVALCVIVLMGAGLLVRTLENLRNINPGFDTHNVLLFQVNPGRLGYKTAQAKNLFGELHDRLAALPGVTSVTYSGAPLLSGGRWFETIHFEGQPEGPGIKMNLFAAGPGFFGTMHIPLVAGRTFTSTDFEDAGKQNPNPLAAGLAIAAATRGTPVNVIVNQAFVHQYFPTQSPLGKAIVEGGGESGADGGAWGTDTRSNHWQIVGVVGDTKYDTLRHEIQPVVYLPFTSGYGGYFELRTAFNPRLLIPAVRDIAAKIAPDLPLTDVSTQTQQIDELISQERSVAQVSGFFGVLALLLACTGLYGLVSYEVSRRTREIGIRVALGAQRHDVLRLVVGRGIILTVGGAVLGMIAGLGAVRYLNSMLFNVRPNDPITMLAVSFLVTLVVLLACYIPARHATRVAPMIALRHE